MIGEFLDAAKEETISALRAELTRLQQSQHAQQAADSALASLQQKIDSLQVTVPVMHVVAITLLLLVSCTWNSRSFTACKLRM